MDVHRSLLRHCKKDWKLKKNRLMPNRYSSTEVYEHDSQPLILKRFKRFDHEKIFNHYQWLKNIEFPLFAKILDIFINDQNEVDVVMHQLEGPRFWEQVNSENVPLVAQGLERLIFVIKEQSGRLYGTTLPAGQGLIHGDFHLGNIFGAVTDTNSLRLIDLDSVKIGNYREMTIEWVFNLMSHPSLREHDQIKIELISKLDLKGATKFERSQNLKTLSDHFYDYYREFSGFMENHRLLLRELEKQI
jgi:hypothetical protein